jgi:fructose 1,6-bisphosphatase
MNTIFKQIQYDVQNHNWYTGGLELLTEMQSNCILKIEKVHAHTRVVERNGDIVVGFYLDQQAPKTQQLKLSSCGVSLPGLSINPGMFVYALNDMYVYPIIAVNMHELRIDSDSYDYLYIVYALIADVNIRRQLATQTNVMRMNGRTLIIKGLVGYVENVENDPQYMQLPDMTKNI